MQALLYQTVWYKTKQNNVRKSRHVFTRQYGIRPSKIMYVNPGRSVPDSMVRPSKIMYANPGTSLPDSIV